MNEHRADEAVLKTFFALPHRASAVLERFAALPSAVCGAGGGQRNFVYIPGTRAKSVLLVAHADTVDEENPVAVELVEADGTIRNAAGILGADDRAGCAMLWLLRNTGHGLLITDGEEYGGQGSWFLRTDHPDLFDEINRRYRFMIQIDRRGASDFKCYNVGTDGFRRYVADKTGFSEPDRRSCTDIVHLCRDICGVNLSCGYHFEHTDREYLVKAEWSDTLRLLRRWLAEDDLPAFPLETA